MEPDDPTDLATPSADGAEAAVAATPGAPADGDTALVEDELLVEEISIDGMCGVY